MTDKRNLLAETKFVMEDRGLTVGDIIYIGDTSQEEYSMSWPKFRQLANIEYDSGYGGQEIKRDLTIVFKDGTQMFRGEYDGSEWWDVIPAFKLKKSNTSPPKTLREEW